MECGYPKNLEMALSISSRIFRVVYYYFSEGFSLMNATPRPPLSMDEATCEKCIHQKLFRDYPSPHDNSLKYPISNSQDQPKHVSYIF